MIDLPENSKSGMVLGTITAEDADEITTFIYRFEEQDLEDGFRIDIYKRDGTKTSDYVKNVRDLPVEIGRKSGIVKLRNRVVNLTAFLWLIYRACHP